MENGYLRVSIMVPIVTLDGFKTVKRVLVGRMFNVEETTAHSIVNTARVDNDLLTGFQVTATLTKQL